jgi:hypothetical protein
MNVINYTVDGEPQSTTEHELTVGQILKNAGIDPTSHYLVEIQGHHQVPYKDVDEVIRMHEHMKFISVSTHPTPVS